MSKTSTDPTPGPTRLALSGPTMGTRWTALAFVPPAFDVVALEHVLQAAVDRVDRQMSTWKPDSDLNCLNAAPVGPWVDVPPELATVLAAALDIGRASGGSFDIGVGDLVKAWGFGWESREPRPESIRAVAGRPTLDPPKTLQLDRAGRRARKLAPLSLDLSGIAKGFGVDELARVAALAGLDSFLVGIDGEMRAAGRKPDGRPWAVGHEKPAPGCRELAGVLELDDVAVATSGTYRHSSAWMGRTVSHTMDPRTGAPLAGDLASVTVIAPTCMQADAWATAIMVAGSDQGLELARVSGLGVVMTRTDGTVSSTL
jgi:thiamine biosynthesis lipoprotein